MVVLPRGHRGLQSKELRVPVRIFSREVEEDLSGAPEAGRRNEAEGLGLAWPVTEGKDALIYPPDGACRMLPLCWDSWRTELCHRRDVGQPDLGGEGWEIRAESWFNMSSTRSFIMEEGKGHLENP